MAFKLTALVLGSLPEGEYPDALQPNLVFRVQKKRRVWTLRYRQGGRKKRVRLGFFPKLGLKDARLEAGKAMKRAEGGAPAPAATPIHPLGEKTLGELLDLYERSRRGEGGRTKTLDRRVRDARRFLGDLEGIPASSLTKADLRAARDRFAPIMANRMLEELTRALDWCAREDFIEQNPARLVRRAPETARHRTLSDLELKAVWKASLAMGTYGRLTRFLALTGCRLGEAMRLRHGDVLDGRWTKGDTKSGRPHRVRLPKAALAELGTGGARDLAFAGPKGGLYGEISADKRRLDKASGVSGWVNHDLRRTCSSGLQELGIDHAIIRFGVLGHTIPGVAQVYLRGDLSSPAGAALEQWAAHVARATGAGRAAS